MMKKMISCLSALLALTLAVGAPINMVNPYIGTGGHGHVFLGANVPFGLVQAGPTQYTHGWDWCSGYHYSDSVLVGFSMMHLSGTGVGDLGDVTLLPTLSASQKDVKFSHRAERVRPGYYAVTLDGGIHVELTATERCALQRYTLPADVERGFIRLDLLRGIGWDRTKECQARVENATTVSGYRYSQGWARDQRIYFVAEFSQAMEVATAERDTVTVFSFQNTGRPLQVRIGLSPISVEGARKNLHAELDTWDFRGVLAQAEQKWNAQLSKVSVEGGTADERTVFYTALYHTMTAPSVFCDADADTTLYTTLSLWDTYRAAHPLMTLIHREMLDDMAYTLLYIYRQQGKLPVWHLMGNETDCMVGNPAIPVLADIVLKTKKFGDALSALKASALLDERGMDLLKQYGYLPFDLHKDNETVAKGLEYALADWCVARVAEQMKDKKTQRLFDERAQAYRRYFDPTTGFMRGKDSKGHFREPFSPFHAEHQANDYTEGNAWQYTWLVPHDVHGLIGLFGSEERFVEKLDSLFVVEGDMGEDAPPDISGLIGQYAHGNEPSHHIIYLYNYAGQPWKGARLARQVMREMYHNGFDGLSGNEDVGQMSAWYVLSAMGLYQVEPAGGKYIIGSPLFDRVTMNVGEGRTFSIVTHDNSEDNIYVQRVLLNGKPYSRSYLMYDDIVSGGVLELQMGPHPSDFGTGKKDRP